MQEKNQKKVLKRGHNIKQKKKKGQKSAKKSSRISPKKSTEIFSPKIVLKKVLKLVLAF